VRRPSNRARRKAALGGELAAVPRQKRSARRRQPLQLAKSRVCDKEVSEPIGLGRSSRRERLRWEEFHRGASPVWGP
jgi:hypothetical protein